jgi:hypothetical protein
MTRLRKMMLEELERRNYSQSTTPPIFRPSRISRGTSGAVPISWAPPTSGNIKLNCSANRNWLPTP